MSKQSIKEDKIQHLSPLQRATFALKKLDKRLNKILHEPIAIIGMGCSFPSGANTPEKFWNLLQENTSAREKIPTERWNIDEYYDPERETVGKICTRYGHFLKSVDQFDPEFFGISPREAAAIDPQHRLLLEVSWQALERAGQRLERLSAQSVGVFVGNDGHDYEQLMQKHLQREPNSSLAIYAGTGNTISSAAGRLAYTFGFTGPTVTIDTACSSSLVAIHQACNSLRLGECEMAIAGGVKLHLTPESYILTSRVGMISPDGLCKTFDISADGYARGEGCGMIVLKPLSKAQEDGDQILALIRGSAVNQDGPSSGLTVPNGQSQQKLIKQALKQAKIEPTEVSYLEAHGTGTSLGDPIEVNAAVAVLGQERPLEQPLWVGTVKTNIGHLEAAAGVSGLIKVVLSMQHQQLPGHLHLQEPNPKIDWQPWLKVPQALTPWVAPKGRFAGVSSFGFTGTNAHVVLSEAPTDIDSPRGEYQRPVHLLQLSAKNEQALVELAQNYIDYLKTHPEKYLGDICFTANSCRLTHKHRLAVVANNREELQTKLYDFIADSPEMGLVSGEISSPGLPKVAMLFTGQGSQYVGMGRQLYETQPTFKAAVDECAEILKEYLDKPLLEILYGVEAQEGIIAQTKYTQPALFAIEYALYKLWSSWGIKPDVVMGHSVGEYVAATVAGIFSLNSGLKLISHRGRLMQQLPPGGEMLSIMASEDEVNQLIAAYSEKVAIAAINGLQSIVISGEAEAIYTIKEKLDSLSIKNKQLQVSHGFHSHLMEPMLEEFTLIANQITYNQPRIPLISNVTGVKVDDSITTANYWVNHIRQPVKFARSMETLGQEGYEIFLEIGPKPILLGMGKQCLPNHGIWLPSLRPNQGEWHQILQSLAELYVKGVKVDWLGFDKDYSRSKVVLPTYPFQRQRYWVETSPKYSRKAITKSNESKTTNIVELFNDGNTQKLVQQLEKVGKFSPEQVNLLPELLETLVEQHQRELNTETIKDCFYEIKWKPSDIIQVQTRIEAGHWLIFADSTGVSEQLAQLLLQQGCEYSLVYRGEKYQKLSENTYQLNPTQPQDFEKIIQSIEENRKLPLQKVIHLWSLDTPTSKDLMVNSLEEAQIWGCGCVLHLIQALTTTTDNRTTDNKATDNRAKLWLVTRGAQSVKSSTEEVSLASSTLWGMGRVISLEHPQLWGGLIDLDSLSLESETQILMQLLADNNQQEDHIALRGELTYIARLVRRSLPAGATAPSPKTSQPLSLDSNVTYLITGGLGALGLHTAKWMVDKGAKNLVLIGRRQASDSIQKTIEELQKTGAKVSVLCGDISQKEDVARIIEEIKVSFPPLRGIIHAAGVLDDGLLSNMSWEQFTKVMTPKVQGTWHLHTLTEHLSLDFFVCFSSMAALMGSPGQGNYAAANALMDGLVHYRRAIGLPGLSVNWGPWAEGGMAANLGSQHQNRLLSHGINPISSQQGLNALEQLLTGENLQTTVVNVNWNLFKKFCEIGGRKLFLEEIEVEEVESQQSSSEQNDSLVNLELFTGGESYNILRNQIQKVVAQELGLNETQLPDFEEEVIELSADSLMTEEVSTRRDKIIQQLNSLIFQTLGFTASSKIDIHQNLLEMGADSLTLMEVGSKVEKVYGVNIPIRKFFEDLTTLDALATYIDINLPEGWKIQSNSEKTLQQSVQDYIIAVVKDSIAEMHQAGLFETINQKIVPERVSGSL